jgi:AcrR family transcriptional regulator
MTAEISAPTDPRAGTRDRLVEVAADLLRTDGRAAVTTRAVAEAAGVQAPTIYRLFGDKEGLLDAVAETEMTRFAAQKAVVIRAAAEGEAGAVDDLRAGWDATIAFALDNPELYALMSDPARGQGSPAVRAGVALLEERVHRVALAGRLRVAEPLAVQLIHAAATRCSTGSSRPRSAAGPGTSPVSSSAPSRSARTWPTRTASARASGRCSRSGSTGSPRRADRGPRGRRRQAPATSTGAVVSVCRPVTRSRSSRASSVLPGTTV